MKSRLLPLLFGIGFLLSNASLADTSSTAAELPKRIVMACNSFPPNKIEDSQDGLPGFDIEFLKTAFEPHGIEVQTPFFPWSRALRLAEIGEVDGLCSCSYRPERTKDLVFSDEIRRIEVGIATLASYSGNAITHLQMLQDQNVGVVAKYNLQDELDEFGIISTAAKDDQLALRMLSAKRFVYFYGFHDPMFYLAAKPELQLSLKFFPIHTLPYFSCFNRHKPYASELVDLFNRELAAMKSDGRFDAILQKYFR